MQATEILMQEHRVIERVLDSLQAVTERVERGEHVRPGFYLEATDFIKGFADGCHHRKEEGVLFEHMVQAGLPKESGPIAVMLTEHEQGRGYTRGMRAAAEKLGADSGAAKDELARSARGYVELLRQHIAKEDGVLFPMADRVIPSAQHGHVLEGFEQVEHEETGEGVHEKYLALAEALEAEAGVAGH